MPEKHSHTNQMAQNINDGIDQMDDLATRLAKRMEADMLAAMTGGATRKPGRSALMVRGGQIVSVTLGDDGKPVERCPFCGPVLLCAKHMALVS